MQHSDEYIERGFEYLYHAKQNKIKTFYNVIAWDRYGS